MRYKTFLLFIGASVSTGLSFAANDFLLASRWNNTAIDLAWESVSGQHYLIYETSDLDATWQLYGYAHGVANTNITPYKFSPFQIPRPGFLRVYQGGELLAVDDFGSRTNLDVEAGHNTSPETSNPYTEYGDTSGSEVTVTNKDMYFNLTSASADDVTVVTEGGLLTNMVSGKRLDFTVLLRSANSNQPGAAWGLGLAYGTDGQWPASLIAMEIEDNGTARFYWNGTLAATNKIPDRDTRYISITFNTVSKRAAVTVNGVEYFFATNAVYDTSHLPQMVMHASKPAGPPATFRVDRYLIAALSTSQQRIVAETSVFNPLYFGADPTGTMDSVPAFNQMLRSLGNSRHSSIYVPPGSYLLNSPLIIPASGNSSQYGMQIRGGGEAVTRFLVNNTAGGMRFAGTSISWMQLTMRDFSFVAMKPGIEYAFYMNVPLAGLTQNRMLDMANITADSLHPNDGNYFKTGFLIWNTWYPKFDNVKVFADGTASNGNWNCQVGLDIKDCYNPAVYDSVFSGVATGLVYAAVSTNAGPEDGCVKNTRFKECATGIMIDIINPSEGGWPEPAFHVNNCDLSFRDYGLYVNGMRQLFFSHNRFQCLDTQGSAFLETGSARDFSPTDIYLNYAFSAVLDHNFFHGPSSTNRVGIDIQPASGYVSILGNQFDMEGTAVENNSFNPVFVRENVYGGLQGISATLREYEAPGAYETLQDGGFEAVFSDPDANRYEYAPSGTPWTCSSSAGYSKAATAFTGGNPTHPEGTQVLLLQKTGQASQRLLLNAGTYTIFFYAAQRKNSGTQIQQLQILLGGISRGIFQPSPSGAYEPFTTTFTLPVRTTYVLTLKGLIGTGDNTVFVDDLRITKN